MKQDIGRIAPVRPLRPVKITGLATYVPPRVLTNADLEKLVNTTDEWILQRTGIRERHIADPGVGTSDLAVIASQGAMAEAGITPDQVGFIVVGTTTPDTIFPSSACLLQTKIGANNAWGFDLGAACSGFTYSLTTAMQMVATGSCDHALAVGADVMSSIIDYTDRTTCVLFGDGAGAVVVEASNASVGVESVVLHSDGSKGELLMLPAGGTKIPASKETIEQGKHLITMQGGEVFKLAVKSMADAAEEAIRDAGVGLDDIALMIPHQANIRIIEGVAKRLHFPMERVFVNIQRYGNTSAASIPIAIAEAESQGRLRRGDKVLLVAFGGGFTWGASVLEWYGQHDGMRPPSPLERARDALEDVVDRVRPM